MVSHINDAAYINHLQSIANVTHTMRMRMIDNETEALVQTHVNNVSMQFLFSFDANSSPEKKCFFFNFCEKSSHLHEYKNAHHKLRLGFPYELNSLIKYSQTSS